MQLHHILGVRRRHQLLHSSFLTNTTPNAPEFLWNRIRLLRFVLLFRGQQQTLVGVRLEASVLRPGDGSHCSEEPQRGTGGAASAQLTAGEGAVTSGHLLSHCWGGGRNIRALTLSLLGRGP
ncbi:uncharacterized [Tachysurus ichikawai]